MNKLNTIIVDDEVLARENIEALLQDDPEIAVVARCGTAGQAIEAVRQNHIDLMFLDVQMPGVDGFELLSRLDSAKRPQVVFVTAFDQYATRAFDVNAVDYLLKPFSRERFSAALSRAKAAYRSRHQGAVSRQIDDLLATLKELRATEAAETAVAADSARKNEADSGTWSGRLLFRSDGEIHVLSPGEIRWIESEGDYVKVHAGAKTKLVRMAMVKILRKLDPAHFVRIHRSTIVNLAHVRKVTPALYGEYTVELAEGVRLKVSRTYVHALKAYL